MNPWTEHIDSTVTAADKKYVVDSWLAAYRTSPFAGCVPNNHYVAVYTDAIEQLLERGARILLVRNAADTTLVVGWLCYEVTPRGDLVVHAAATKPLYRHQGVFTALVQHVMAESRTTRYFFTYRTPACRFYKAGTYEPAIARRRGHAVEVE